MNEKKGFTLVEILITIAVAAVLTGAAAVGFTRSMEKADANQAVAYLRTIHTAQKMYYGKWQNFLPMNNSAEIKAELGAETQSRRYAFQVVPVGAGFLATATGPLGSISVDQDGVFSATGTALARGYAPAGGLAGAAVGAVEADKAAEDARLQGASDREVQLARDRASAAVLAGNDMAETLAERAERDRLLAAQRLRDDEAANLTAQQQQRQNELRDAQDALQEVRDDIADADGEKVAADNQTTTYGVLLLATGAVTKAQKDLDDLPPGDPRIADYKKALDDATDAERRAFSAYTIAAAYYVTMLGGEEAMTAAKVQAALDGLADAIQAVADAQAAWDAVKPVDSAPADPVEEED